MSKPPGASEHFGLRNHWRRAGRQRREAHCRLCTTTARIATKRGTQTQDCAKASGSSRHLHCNRQARGSGGERRPSCCGRRGCSAEAYTHVLYGADRHTPLRERGGPRLARTLSDRMRRLRKDVAEGSGCAPRSKARGSCCDAQQGDAAARKPFPRRTARREAHAVRRLLTA